MAADEALRCLPPLGGLLVSSRAAALPGSHAASGDALNGAPVQAGEGFCKKNLSHLQKYRCNDVCQSRVWEKYCIDYYFFDLSMG